MPRTPNPRRMGTPLVYEFPITSTPTATPTPIGLSLDGIAILETAVLTTTPEATGTDKNLHIGSTDEDGAYGEHHVSSTGVSTCPPEIRMQPPTPGLQVTYTAQSGDWAEFRGILKILYAPFSAL